MTNDPWSEAGGAVGAEVLEPYDEIYSAWRVGIEAAERREVDFSEVWADGRCVYCSAKVGGVEIAEYALGETEPGSFTD